jgi:hypothetical protein
MEHKVKLNLNTNVVGHKDVSIEVSGGGRKLGTVLISKGNIEWLPSPKSKNKHRLSWTKFAEMMTAGKVAKAKPKNKPARKATPAKSGSARRAA